jgi:hypothetical protein
VIIIVWTQKTGYRYYLLVVVILLVSILLSREMDYLIDKDWCLIAQSEILHISVKDVIHILIEQQSKFNMKEQTHNLGFSVWFRFSMLPS